MEERLQNSAAEGDVEALYSTLAQDPYILERIDHIPFVETPLHVAASAGKIHFAKEIVSLKPSFTRKRDHLGRTPMHLALENGQRELVTWFLTFDSELVRVKGKGMVTPFHYAAEIDDDLNLADFLYVCPSSINDLTVKCESAVHVALKNGSFRALKVLVGWLRHFDKEKILKWEDENGDSALHIATSTNQTKAIKLLIGYVKVNKKNLGGSTALDIFYLHQDSLDPKIRKILRKAKAKRASELDVDSGTLASRLDAVYLQSRSHLLCSAGRKSTLVDYLSGNLPFEERILKWLGIGDQSLKKIPSEIRNVVLVVAILNATATYQAALSPPGGYWQDSNVNIAVPSASNNKVNDIAPTTGNSDLGRSQHLAGQMIMTKNLSTFFLTNSLAFYTSICTILIVTVGLPFSRILRLSSYMLLFAYYSAVTETAPSGDWRNKIKWFILIPSLFIVSYIPLVLSSKEGKLKHYGQSKLRRGSYKK